MHKKVVKSISAQSAIEYLMTYGWAILIIAVVLAALFELGVFNGSNLSPQACIAQAGFVCKNPVYTANGIGIIFGQTTGREYFDSFMFIAAEGEPLSGTGIPQNFTDPSNGLFIGNLLPGQTVGADFNASKFAYGQIPANAPIGTPFAGYVWLGYCLSPCSAPTAYSKVATITAKEAGTSSASFGGYFGGGSGSSSPPPAPPPAQQFSFTVSVSPTSNTIAAGQSTHAVVTITTPISNNANVVTLSDTAPPTITKTFKPMSCRPDPTCTSILSISATPSAQPGSYPITVTGTNALTGATSNAVYTLTVTSPYVQITLHPATQISGQFQQNITFAPSTYLAYESSDLGNIRFCTDPTCGPGNSLDSWLEGCPETACSPSSSQAIFWVKLPNGETSGENIYMVFGPTSGAGSEFDGSIAGEAPQISQTYAQYDNGANVFNNYWNFSGPGLPGSWSAFNQNYIVSDGLSVTAASSASAGYVGYSTTTQIPFIEDAYITSWAQAGGCNWGMVVWGGGDALNNPFNAYHAQLGDNTGCYGSQWQLQVGTSYENINAPNTGINSWYFTNPTTYFYENYVLDASLSGGAAPSSLVIGGQVQNAASGTTTVQWLRIRAYPPNGVMPGYSFGSVQ